MNQLYPFITKILTLLSFRVNYEWNIVTQKQYLATSIEAWACYKSRKWKLSTIQWTNLTKINWWVFSPLTNEWLWIKSWTKNSELVNFSMNEWMIPVKWWVKLTGDDFASRLIHQVFSHASFNVNEQFHQDYSDKNE